MADPTLTTTSAPDAVSSTSLNDLPDDVVIHILSFLPTKSAIQSSLISRKWRNLWTQLSCLNFPYSFTATAAASAGTFVTPRSFSDFISQTLLQRHPKSPSLHSFDLEFDFRDRISSSHVDSWLRYAIHHRVQEIKLDFFMSTEFQAGNFPENELVYKFHLSLLRNGRVKLLRLIKCDIIFPYDMASMRLKTLGSVFLDQVCLSDQMVSDLISGCVNLECLSLEHCYGMKDVKICSLKLKHLYLNYFNANNGSLEICCPNLVSLEMIGFVVDKYKFEDFSSLVEASVFFLHKLEYYGHWSQVMRSLVHVRRLAVQNWWFKVSYLNRDGPIDALIYLIGICHGKR
uniref:F-box domain-containing protein n=1 Tax=Rhizophora mucronata TaxID=61149 RepID=A0A2P2IJN0_RHIMU